MTRNAIRLQRKHEVDGQGAATEYDDTNELKKQTARTITSSAFNSAVVVNAYVGKSADAAAVHTTLKDYADNLQAVGLASVETMLLHQSIALQSMFMDLAVRAKNQTSLDNVQVLTQLALKAQSGCRSTLQALAEVRNPRNVSFVRQTNVAHTQQVNNGVAKPSRTRKNRNTPNKLLVEECDDGQNLDSRTKVEAGRGG